MHRTLNVVCVLGALCVLPVAGLHAQKPRERDLKLPIGGTAGPLDAITDVAGVEVGHTTLNTGSGKLVVGRGRCAGCDRRSPAWKANPDPVFAAWFTLNGNGEMTGTTWVQESGLLEGPVAITNTHSVGVVRDAIIQWEVSQKNALQPWWLPVVAETYDGGLNDINGFHVKPEHVLAALDGASGGMPEGRRGGRRHRDGLPRLQGRHRHGVREHFRRTRAATRSAYSCNATTDRAATCGSPVSRSARKFRIWPAASPTTIRCRRMPAAAIATNVPASGTTRPNKARSSSSWRRMRRCCPIS